MAVVAAPSVPVDQTPDSSGYYINNLVTEASYLMTQGYSPAAAAGIAGTTAGESSGDPEAVGSGGAGLIGWTPPSKASPYQPIVSGNAQQDYDYQLADIVGYNDQQGTANLQSLNAQTDPVQAADFYSQTFERPAVTDSDVRANVAQYVFEKVQGLPTTGNLGQGTPGDKNTNPATLTSFNPLSPSSWIQALTGQSVLDMLERGGLIIFGGFLIIIGFYLLAGKQTINVVAGAASKGEV